MKNPRAFPADPSLFGSFFQFSGIDLIIDIRLVVQRVSNFFPGDNFEVLIGWLSIFRIFAVLGDKDAVWIFFAEAEADDVDSIGIACPVDFFTVIN
ncbi:hypothetical protein CHCC20494_4223 [Bacillus licheniformis]|nr:hypothetical protein CHCC20494_4223 [Bacillus licheniformis]